MRSWPDSHPLYTTENPQAAKSKDRLSWNDRLIRTDSSHKQKVYFKHVKKEALLSSMQCAGSVKWEAAIDLDLVTKLPSSLCRSLAGGPMSIHLLFAPTHLHIPAMLYASQQHSHRAGNSVASSISYSRLQDHKQALPTSHDHNEIANDHI